jgi:hypothetical protein
MKLAYPDSQTPRFDMNTSAAAAGARARVVDSRAQAS